ncbi:MAG: lipopolysaccharide kinase InaA family protein [Planctomycetota bacterium]
MPEFVTQCRGAMTWTLREECAQWILDHVADGLAAAEPPEGWELVKENNVRAIYTIPLADSPGSRGYLKRFKCRGVWERLKHMVAPSKAAAEWRTVNRLLDLGIPVPRPLAMAERRSGIGLTGESILLTEAVPDAAPLSDVLLKAGERAREDLLMKAAELVHLLHEKSCFHGDLHVGNILAVGPAGEARLVLLDLHRVRFKRALSQRDRIENLAMLLTSMHTRAPEEDQWRFFFGRYADLERLAPFEEGRERGEWIVQITNRIMDIRRTRFRSRTKRCLINSSGFAVEDRAGRRIFRKRAIPEDMLTQAIDAHMGGRADRIKEGGASSVSRMEIAHEGKTIPICVKENRYGLLDMVKGLVRMSRGRRAWVGGNGLAIRGYETCEMFGLVEERFLGLVRRSFLVMEYLGEMKAIDRYAYEDVIGFPPKRRRAITRALAAHFTELEEAGVYHSDLKASNILVREKEEDWAFFLVDLDSIRFPRRPQGFRAFRCQIRGLAQLNSALRTTVTNADRMRFFLHYLYGGQDVLRQGHRRDAFSRGIARLVLKETAKRDCVWNRRGAEEAAHT